MVGNGGNLARQGGGLEGKNVIGIGGGVSGLFSSIHLAQAGADVTILEADSTLHGRKLT